MSDVYAKMSAVSKDLLAGIEKGRKTSGEKFQYSYRGIEDIMNALAPLLVEHGLVITPSVVRYKIEEIQTPGYKPGEIKITYSSSGELSYTITAVSDGSTVTGSVPVHALDNSDKGANKLASYGYRYFVSQAFCIPFADMRDGEEDDIRVTRKSDDSGGGKETQAAPKDVVDMQLTPGGVMAASKRANGGAKHWIDDDKARSAFWVSATNLLGKEGNIEGRVKNILGVTSMHDYKGNQGQALTALKEWKDKVAVPA